MKNSDDAIGNRTRDLPACSAVPQPTAPLRSPYLNAVHIINLALTSLVHSSTRFGPAGQSVERTVIIIVNYYCYKTLLAQISSVVRQLYP